MSRERRYTLLAAWCAIACLIVELVGNVGVYLLHWPAAVTYPVLTLAFALLVVSCVFAVLSLRQDRCYWSEGEDRCPLHRESGEG